MTEQEYSGVFSALQARLEGPEWLADWQTAQFQRFETLGLPTRKLEDWRFTSLKRLRGETLSPVALRDSQPDAVALPKADLERLSAEGTPLRLVFIDGRPSSAHQNLSGLPKGIRVTTLREAIAADDTVTRSHLTTHEHNDHAFAALNAAFLDDGVVVHVSKSAAIETPIHLTFVATADGPFYSVHPRVLIVAEENAQVTVLEHYLALGDAKYLTNAVTQIHLGKHAVVRHLKLVEEGPGATHVHRIDVTQDRGSQFANYNFSLSGGLVRNDITCRLEGENCNCVLDGLYLTAGDELFDTHSVVDHTVPHCDSWELYKGILADKSRAVFNGKIFVRAGAQKTDAKQSNRNLLLSSGASVNTKPQLEIWADDVRCTHGATIGELDEEALFYLRTRGLNADEAHGMLTFAFANEVIERIPVDSFRDYLKSQLRAWFAEHGTGA